MANKITTNQEFEKEYIVQLYNETKADYELMRNELRFVYKGNYENWPFAEVDGFDDSVGFVAFNLIRTEFAELSADPDYLGNSEVLYRLKRANPLQNEELRDLISATGDKFVATKRYLEKTNYLRLLIIQYCENYLVKKENITYSF